MGIAHFATLSLFLHPAPHGPCFSSPGWVGKGQVEHRLPCPAGTKALAVLSMAPVWGCFVTCCHLG